MKPDFDRLAQTNEESGGHGRLRGLRWALAAPSLGLALLLSPALTRADEGGLFDVSGVLSGMSFAGGPALWIPMRPTGHFASPGHVGVGASGGVFIGVDTGVALALASGFDPAHDAWTFGGRAGYEFRNGLALQLRYDYLGLAPHFTTPPASPTQIGSAGVRYSIPFLIPLPFFEAMWGPSFNGDSVSIAGGLGVGASVPIGRHLRIDASVRDWITPIDDQVHQILTFELGAAVSFASPGH
jgi:hypothetical protein